MKHIPHLFGFIASFIGIIVLFLLVAKPAYGTYTQPSFPSCSAPSGTIIASYATGTHAIAGDPNLHTGSDTVYQESDITVMQCFCPDDLSGKGIQTNWWDVADLSSDDIQTLIGNGWINEPNGSDWGLNNAPYLAMNSNFDCSAETPTPTPSVTPEITPTATPSATPTPNPGNGSGGGGSSSSSSSNSGGSSSTSSQPATSQPAVQTLASTGTFFENAMSYVFGLGILFILMSLNNYVKESFQIKKS